MGRVEVAWRGRPEGGAGTRPRPGRVAFGPRSGALLGRAGEAVAEAPGLGAGVDDVRAVGEPVNDSLREPGVGEHLGPLAERQIGRDDQRPAFVAFGEHLEDELGRAVGES